MAEISDKRHARRGQGLAVLVLGLMMMPVLIWWESVGDITIYLEYETPPGQVSYIFSKLAGLYAIMLLWLQVVLALTKGTPAGRTLSFWNLRFHRYLGIGAFAFILMHAALFLTAVSVRKGHLAYGVLLPKFGEGFYAFAVALGVLALYGSIMVVIAGYLRTRGVRTAKWLHRISLAAVAAALVHCLLIGTETRSVLMLAVYSLMSAALVVALYCRFGAACAPATGIPLLQRASGD
jgi:predicted ferric reductase